MNRMPHRRTQNPRLRRALTLWELLAVLSIMAMLTAVVAPNIRNSTDNARATSTAATLASLRTAIIGPYHEDLRAFPSTAIDIGPWPRFMADLLRQPITRTAYEPVSRVGWNGPYIPHSGGSYAVDLSHGFTLDYYSGNDALADPAILDAWGHPIVLQWPSFGDLSSSLDATKAAILYGRLVSAGPNGVLETPSVQATIAAPWPTLTECGDDLVLFLNAADRRAK